LVERQHAEWFKAESVVPGAEVHDDRDVTWVVHNGQAWRNAGIMVRFSVANAPRRLDTLVARYQRHGRGMALWISPSATPTNITDLLAERHLRCRTYFPAMVRNLHEAAPRSGPVIGLEIRRVIDAAEFERAPHPAIGPLTTPLRRAAFERLHFLASEPSGRTRELVAWLKGEPVGAIEVFMGSQAAGIHSLTVLPRYQQRGIGTALIEHACEEARHLGASMIALLASSEGHRVYVRRGFREVARFEYWYRSFQRNR
jgi:GNAT superfamily N-acetyltransferase